MKKLIEPDSLDHLLVQVCRLHHAMAHSSFEPLGLYRGQPVLLDILWQEDGLTHSDLARYLDVTPATITKMVQRMEKSGWLERRDDPDDQRVSRVFLTTAGCEIKTKLEHVKKHLDRETFAGLTAEERDTLYELLLKVRENLLDLKNKDTGLQ